MSAATQHALTFDQAVEGYLRAHGQLSFLQIGGYDGVSYDPLRPHILKGQLTGVIVEPVPMHFEKLQALYAGSDLIKIENCAVDRDEGERTMWFFSREAIANGTIGQVFGGITSFLLPNLLEKGGTLGGLYNDANRAILNSLVESITVPCHSYDTVMARHGLERIDLLQIDTEGYDYELLKAFDFARHRPAIVHYECQHLQPQDAQAAEALLRSHGYVLSSNAYDTLAVRGVFIDTVETDTAELASVAAALLEEGRGREASVLYEHLHRLVPGDVSIALASVSAASLAGRHAEAVSRFTAIVQRGGAPTSELAPLFRTVCHAAVNAFNTQLAAGDLAAAGSIMDSLAAMLPHKFTAKALDVASTRGDIEATLRYAHLLLEQDATHWRAHAALADIAKARGDQTTWLRHLTGAVLHRPRGSGQEDKLFSSEAVYVISEMLIGRPDPEWPALINALRDGVAACPETFQTESQSQLDRFMRVGLESMDPAILDEPLSWEAPPVPVLAVADSSGASLELARLPEYLRAITPQVVFLAAADETYLRRYGRHYLDSILQRCDVNCAVLLCMVGQVARLQDVIDAIGVRDPRVVYLVDEFDPAYAVTYYTRTKALTNCARAYYQSARFLLLDHLLHALDLPIVVTDIDLSLQGSLAGLLQRHRDAGVVLNRNDITVSYGSCFTANLLLVRPGKTGRQLARLLRLLLQRALKRQDIEQFIDQSMLTLAQHVCRQHGLDDFNYFAVDEINNVMFNNTALGTDVVNVARTYVFFAYYGSEGDTAVNLMKAVGGED
jgi:FkbM family methyltransferase